jgi:hypothetical protein
MGVGRTAPKWCCSLLAAACRTPAAHFGMTVSSTAHKTSRMGDNVLETMKVLGFEMAKTFLA